MSSKVLIKEEEQHLPRERNGSDQFTATERSNTHNQSSETAHKERRLVVTFFRNKNAFTDDGREPDTAENRASLATDGQQALSSEFVRVLENILSKRLSRIGEEETNAPWPLSIFPYVKSIEYGEGVLQSIYFLQDDQPLDLKSIREDHELRNFEATHQRELVLDLFHAPLAFATPDPSSYRPFRLALFDMDSTLINEEVIDELARSIGVYDQVSAITHRAMNDPTFDFAASLKARVALLKGVPADIWTSLQKQVTIATGAKELIAGLKDCGIVTGVISGGFTPMAEWLKGELGLDLAFANHLATSGPTAEYDYPHLTGELDLSGGKVIVTPEYKRATLIAEADKRGIPLEQTLAAGDGSNDLQMLNAAGLGIAWNAKPKTQEMAPMRLNGTSLTELLFLLGPAVKLQDRYDRSSGS